MQHRVRTAVRASGAMLALVLAGCAGGTDGTGVDDPTVSTDPPTATGSPADEGVEDGAVEADMTLVEVNGVSLTVTGQTRPAEGLTAYELTLEVRNDTDEPIGVLPLPDGPAEPEVDEDGTLTIRVLQEPDAGPGDGAARDSPPVRDGVAVRPGSTASVSATVGLSQEPPIDLRVCLETKPAPGLGDGDDRVRFVASSEPRSEVTVVCSEPTRIT